MAHVSDQRPQLHEFALEVDVLLGLRCQEPLGVPGQRLGPGEIRTALTRSSSTRETLEHRGQRTSLLANDGASRGVHGGLGDVIMEAKGTEAHRRHGVPRWP